VVAGGFPLQHGLRRKLQAALGQPLAAEIGKEEFAIDAGDVVQPSDDFFRAWRAARAAPQRAVPRRSLTRSDKYRC